MRLISSALLFAVPYFTSALTVLEPAQSSSIHSFYKHDSLPGHSLRVKRTDESVCAGSEGLAGYLDIDEGDKHIFFWAFESRNDPVNDPVILWMTGGPGCAGSGIGLFKELGPCLMNDQNTTSPNPFAWNNNATVIFIDQPVNVGFSYSSDTVRSLQAATVDTYHFMTMFLDAFPVLQARPFYIAGESYGGSWVPSLAAYIQASQSSMPGLLQQTAYTPSLPHINLSGIMLGNPGVDDALQWMGFYKSGCLGTNPIFNKSTCALIATSQPRCDRAIAACQASNQDMIICAPLLDECRKNSVFKIFEEGLNPYDVRRKCEGNSGLCYNDFEAVEDYLNREDVQEKIGIERPINFKNCNMQVSEDFRIQGDVNRPSSKTITYLLTEGIPVLFYAGDKDWFCNSAGINNLVDHLPWPGQSVFRAKPLRDWKTRGHLAGRFKTWQNLAFVEVKDAGHMAPMDRQPEVLDLINSWISGTFLDS